MQTKDDIIRELAKALEETIELAEELSCQDNSCDPKIDLEEYRALVRKALA